MVEGALRQVAKRVRQRGYRRRSDAYRWLRRRHATLAKLLAEHEPAWADIAAEMAAAGIVGGRARPLTADAVRRIWGRVCLDVERVCTSKPSRVGPPGWTPAAAAKPARQGAAPPTAPAGSSIERLRAWAKDRSGVRD